MNVWRPQSCQNVHKTVRHLDTHTRRPSADTPYTVVVRHDENGFCILELGEYSFVISLGLIPLRLVFCPVMRNSSVVLFVHSDVLAMSDVLWSYFSVDLHCTPRPILRPCLFSCKPPFDHFRLILKINYRSLVTKDQNYWCIYTNLLYMVPDDLLT